MQNKGNGLKIEGVTYYDTRFGPLQGGQLFGHGYASGHGQGVLVHHQKFELYSSNQGEFRNGASRKTFLSKRKRKKVNK